MITGYGATIVDGAQLTFQLALLSILLAIVLGPLGAAFRLLPVRWLAWCGDLYAMVVHGTPDPVLILLVFYGGQGLLNWVVPQLGYDDYTDLSPFVPNVDTLGFVFGAYLLETFRGAFMAIPKGQDEAGHAYGMSHRQALFRVQVPQMARLAIPGSINNWLVLVKAIVLISAISLQDMMSKAKQASDVTREPFTYYLAVAGLCLPVTSVSLLLLRLLGRCYPVGVKIAGL